MCFTTSFIEHWLLVLVVVVAVVAFAKLALGKIFSMLGIGGDWVIGAINILIWVVVAIFAIKLFFEVLPCVAGI